MSSEEIACRYLQAIFIYIQLLCESCRTHRRLRVVSISGLKAIALGPIQHASTVFISYDLVVSCGSPRIVQNFSEIFILYKAEPLSV
jgi:hypothetical protein